MTEIDHFLYGTSDLDRAVAHFENETGLKAIAGGRHENYGTRNALIGLDQTTYFEILAPDPEQADNVGASPMLRALPEDGLIAWCARSPDLEALAKCHTTLDNRRRIGPTEWRRLRSDGEPIEWRLLHVEAGDIGALQPFFIDWGDVAHPTASLEPQGALKKFHLETPYRESLSKAMHAADLTIDIQDSEQNGMELIIDTGSKTVTLRSPAQMPPQMLPE